MRWQRLNRRGSAEFGTVLPAGREEGAPRSLGG